MSERKEQIPNEAVVVVVGNGDHRKQLRASLDVVDRPADPASSISTAARFVVDAGRPGPVAA